MKCNNIELKEVDSVPKDFTPHKMFCWTDNSLGYVSEYIIAIVKRSDDILFISDHSIWPHGAEIPEAPKPRRDTWKQLAYWLMDGNGLVLDSETGKVDTGVFFDKKNLYEEVGERWKVMRREDNDWNEITADYMGLE